MRGIKANVLLPKPDCLYGYSKAALDEIFSEKNFPMASRQLRETFNSFMRGQTMSICSGKQYNYDTGEYEPSECADNPHGSVVYVCDVAAFFQGRYPLD